MEIIPNVHHMPGIVASPYLIVDPDGLTLIDTGVRSSDQKILKYIAGLGRAPGNLKRILITHSDGDHVGSLTALKAATGARVYASRIEAEATAAGPAIARCRRARRRAARSSGRLPNAPTRDSAAQRIAGARLNQTSFTSVINTE